MDEHTITEHHLGEEFLQQITGGCKECTSDLIVFKGHQLSNAIHIQSATEALHREQLEQSQFHVTMASRHATKATNVIARIAQREATPGHVVIDAPQLPPGRRWVM